MCFGDYYSGNSGVCREGPWHGKWKNSEEKTMRASWQDNYSMGEVPMLREGQYQYEHGVWIWYGPKFVKRYIPGGNNS
jgi:hypothetical protein